jgi:hypothetical protein
MPVIPLPGQQPFPPGADGWCGWDVDVTPGICASWASYDPAVQDLALSIATTVMWAATGRRFGPCQVTVRPCQSRERAETYRAFPVWWSSAEFGGMFTFPLLFDGTWSNCGCGNGCCCRPHCEILLDGPVASIIEIMMHGEVVPSTEYRVDVVEGTYRLVKTSAGCWPTCQDFDQAGTGDKAFQVTYARGAGVPPALTGATALLACNLGKQLAGGDCGLPPRLSSLTRQGVSAEFIASAVDVDVFETGINEVDMVIRALNPGRRTRPPVVLSMDLPDNRDRMTIIGGP